MSRYSNLQFPAGNVHFRKEGVDEVMDEAANVRCINNAPNSKALQTVWLMCATA